LWEATGKESYRQRRDEQLRRAEQLSLPLDSYATTSLERKLLAEIRTKTDALYGTMVSPTPELHEARTQAIDELLEVVDRFQAENANQMEASVHAAERLHEVVGYWVIALSLGTVGLLIVGSYTIVSRVVRPVLMLTHAANAFGGGDLSTRVPVVRNDELGQLARTFNNMADDIANRETERMRFVAMVAHDLKNPVLAIEMATRVLRTTPDNEQERNSYLDGIADEAKCLRKIVRDLTDDIQVASGRFSVQKAPVDLGGLVRRLVESHGQALAGHQVVVETDECITSADAERIERVVANLLSNAVKYSPRDTCITVRVKRSGAFTTLSVSDQGPGIAREDLKAIFQPFGRGRSADLFAEGTGMGLYIVKQIVEAHDGRIEVHSELGKGTTFLIRLPLAPNESLRDPHTRSDKTQSRRLDSATPAQVPAP
jgi:two-component system sensor histidine kinase MtrB